MEMNFHAQPLERRLISIHRQKRLSAIECSRCRDKSLPTADLATTFLSREVFCTCERLSCALEAIMAYYEPM
jgi:hypothetical protein